ncbi:hypothetical protein D3C84_947650 [compost metagenome]
MRSGESGVGKKRLAVLLAVFQVADQLVGVEVRGVEILRHLHRFAVFAIVHLFDFCRVDARGFEVGSPALQQCKRLLKPALIRPLIRFQPQVPFTDHKGVVTALLQQLGNRVSTLIQVTLIPRLSPLKRL